MPALSDDYMIMLKRELLAHYVPHLSPLIPNSRPAEEQQDKQISRAFSAFALRQHLGVTPMAAAEAVIDDFNDSGIDAIYYDESSETLFLVQSKLKASEFSQADAREICAGCRLLINKNTAAFNEHFQRNFIKIEAALGACSHIRILIAYSGARVSLHAETALSQLINDPSLGEERLAGPIIYYSSVEVGNSLRDMHSYPRVSAQLHLNHYGKVTEPRKTYFGVVRLQDLVALHESHGKALYEENIRYFLGSSKSDVNRSIQKTLIESPGDFFYLNNGVTALCDQIDPKDGTLQRKKFKLLGISIINGAQTVASAAELMRSTNPPDISEAKVMLTLIQTRADGIFAPQVTRARNHQNPISTANFAALDPQQERLRQELACSGISYHYRPETRAVPDKTNILLGEALVALALLEPDPRYAVWLKASIGTISDARSPYYQAIFNDVLRGCRLANAVYLMRNVYDLIRIADLGSVGLERLVYRHGSNAIAFALLKRFRERIDSAEIILPAEIPALLSAPFDALRQQAADLFQSMRYIHGPLAHFRSQEHTTPYLSSLMTTGYGLVGDPALVPLNSRRDDEFPRARLFQFLSQRAPQV